MNNLTHRYLIYVTAACIVAVIAFGMAPQFVSAGFGISPPWIENQHAFPGASFERTITITQEKAPKDLKVHLSFSGADVSGWIQVKEGNDFIIPQGTTKFPVHFVVTIPQETPFGFYEGAVDIVGLDPEKGEGQVAVALGAQARIKINVSDEEFSDFQIKKTDIPDIEEGWPLKVGVTLENLGNRPVRPSRVALRIWDTNHTQQLFSYDITDMSFVEPFVSGESIGSVTPEIFVGQYWAEIEVYKAGELTLGDRIRFEVFPRWGLQKKPIIKAVVDMVFGTTVGIIVFSVLVTLVVVSTIFAFIMKRMKRS